MSKETEESKTELAVGAVGGCLYMAVVIMRWTACIDAFKDWNWGFFSGFAGTVAAVLPFVGAIVAYIGATKVWSWKPMAALVFAAPELMLPAGILMAMIWYVITWPFTRQKAPPPDPSRKTPFQLAKEEQEERYEVEQLIRERQRAQAEAAKDPDERWKPKNQT